MNFRLMAKWNFIHCHQKWSRLLTKCGTREKIVGILKILPFCSHSRLVSFLMLLVWCLCRIGYTDRIMRYRLCSNLQVQNETNVKNLKLKIAENQQLETNAIAYCLCEKQLLFQSGINQPASSKYREFASLTWSRSKYFVYILVGVLGTVVGLVSFYIIIKMLISLCKQGDILQLKMRHLTSVWVFGSDLEVTLIDSNCTVQYHHQ